MAHTRDILAYMTALSVSIICKIPVPFADLAVADSVEDRHPHTGNGKLGIAEYEVERIVHIDIRSVK